MTHNYTQLLQLVLVSWVLGVVRCRAGTSGGSNTNVVYNYRAVRYGSYYKNVYYSYSGGRGYARYSRVYNTAPNLYPKLYNYMFDWFSTNSYTVYKSTPFGSISVCKNYEADSNGTYLGIFTCPLPFVPEDHAYCCGVTNAQYCCRFWDVPQNYAAAMLVVLMGMLLLFTIIYISVQLVYNRCKKAQARREMKISWQQGLCDGASERYRVTSYRNSIFSKKLEQEVEDYRNCYYNNSIQYDDEDNNNDTNEYDTEEHENEIPDYDDRKVIVQNGFEKAAYTPDEHNEHRLIFDKNIHNTNLLNGEESSIDSKSRYMSGNGVCLDAFNLRAAGRNSPDITFVQTKRLTNLSDRQFSTNASSKGNRRTHLDSDTASCGPGRDNVRELRTVNRVNFNSLINS